MTDAGIGVRRGLPGLSYPEENLKRLAGELTAKFAGVFSAETVERYVLESYTALLRTSTVTVHLASRTVRFATDRLTALAQAKGSLGVGVPEILFVCEQNAGRSQMAAVLTKHLSGGRADGDQAARSAKMKVSRAIRPAVQGTGGRFEDPFRSENGCYRLTVLAYVV